MVSSTERLLEVGSTAGRIMKRDPIGYAPFAQVIYGVDNAEMDDSAKRLAASWNLCQGIPTHALESRQYLVVHTDDFEDMMSRLSNAIVEKDGEPHA